jgi:predicted RNA binding protein YcfA (HicA-like mRNA interferase family)
MNGKELLEILTKQGWKLDRIKGSHHILVKAGHRSIPIPVHGAKDLHPHLVSTILKQAGLKQ